ncbi:MAG: tetratricopeptide repeat protein [Bdellovibrionaceae bacterium]|nr:tetratricopeptide repeat protein [Pseudobdellovibrionaceae bacterium]
MSSSAIAWDVKSFIDPTQYYSRDLRLIYNNNGGVVNLRADKKTEALDQFIGLTAEHPDDLWLQFNIASTLQVLAQEEKAVKIYQEIAEGLKKQLPNYVARKELAEYQTLFFAVEYNLGVAYQFMGKIDEALAAYQNALAIMPESKEIKTNIELMFAGGQGKGKGKSNDKNQQDKQKGEGEGEGDSDQNDDQKNKDAQSQQQEQKDQQKNQGDKKDKKKQQGFDAKYMSPEDLKRIMEELKEQEQGIRAKMERKGKKSEPKDKEW